MVGLQLLAWPFEHTIQTCLVCSSSFFSHWSVTFDNLPYTPTALRRSTPSFNVVVLLWDLRALGILTHEMLHGEPPFGYGGPDLPRCIAAGLPTGAPHRAENIPTARSDTDDGGKFLPVVRCGIHFFFQYFRTIRHHPPL